MRAGRFVQALCFAAAMTFAAGTADAAAKPKNATAKCSDGTYSTAKTHRGACTAHGGVATWYKEPKDTKEAKDTKEPKESKASKEQKESKAEKKSGGVGTSGRLFPWLRPEPRPTDAPGKATAQCNDGTYSYAKHHQGACSGHSGVKAWYK